MGAFEAALTIDPKHPNAQRTTSDFVIFRLYHCRSRKIIF
jgi:hypothetical protein